MSQSTSSTNKRGDQVLITQTLPRNALVEEEPNGTAPQRLSAVTSAALIVPLVLLRRAQNVTTAPVAATRLHAMGSAPPRRSVRAIPGPSFAPPSSAPGPISQTTMLPEHKAGAPPPRRVPSHASTVQPMTASTSFAATTIASSSKVGPLERAEEVDSSTQADAEDPEAEVDVLMGAKAFGYATLMVGVGAMFTIWGVRTALGVDTAEEFGQRMRQILRREMPSLAAGLYGDVPATSPELSTTGASHAEPGHEWTWPAAEERLTATFERDGFEAWVKHAEQELQSESAIEKRKRDALVAPLRGV